ncbi:MAG: terminase family protein [Candidatus Bathyarchaeota archaeon]|nr:terminase family protein [Candidatus Bathyarchaeota archaeon]
MPRSLRVKAKTMRPNKYLIQWQKVQRSNLLAEELALEKTEGLSANPVDFCREILKFKPYAYQEEFIKLFVENQFIAARWSRQSGKSFIVAALLLWYAITHPDSAIGIVGPSYRQTKRILSRIGSLSRKLPSGLVFAPQRTQIHFSNGSVIEAFPNNPETIRGPTLHVVYADEFNFVANDQALYDAILYTLGTTNGKFVCTSTPWHTDSVFYKMFTHKDFADYKTSHVTVEQAMEPNGPLKPSIIQKIRTQMGDDPIRWRREMEAEWTEDQDVWLTQSLIASCIGTTATCGEDLKEYNPETERRGQFYAGLDLAQTRDYSVLAVVERKNERLFLRHLKIFQQPTIYATVLGYLKALQDRWGKFERIRVDFTREGPSIIADMQNAKIYNAEGVNFSVPRKSEMASLLKQRMANHQFFYPLLSWERPYRGDICNELNVERYSLNKDGTIGYHHPQGTHDDVFWAVALAVYATAEMGQEPFFASIPR